MECFCPLKDVKYKFSYSNVTVTCLTILLISVVCLSVWALVEGRVQPWVSGFTWHLWDRSLVHCIFRGSCPWASQVALPHLHRAVECPDYRPSCPAYMGLGIWTQVLTLAGQALYSLGHLPLHLPFYFFMSLEIEPRALCTFDKHSTLSYIPGPFQPF